MDPSSSVSLNSSLPLSTPLDRLVYLPRKIVSKIVSFVHDVAMRVFYLVTIGKSHPFERTEEQKEYLASLGKKLSHIELPAPRPVLSSPNFHAVWDEAHKKVALVDNTKHSKELLAFRIFCKQVVTSFTKSWVISSGKMPTDENDRNDIISGVGMLCDKLTLRLATVLEQPDLAANLFDDVLKYANDESKSHEAAIQSAVGEKPYHTEYDKIFEHQKKIANYVQKPQQQANLKKQYVDTTKLLIEKAKEGCQLFCRNEFYKTYAAHLEKNRDNGKAIVAAYEVYKYQTDLYAIYFKEYLAAVEGGHIPKAAHEAAVLKVNTEQLNPPPPNCVKVPDSFLDACLQLYLQNCYAEMFIKQDACSVDVKDLLIKMNACVNVGEAEQIYRDYVRDLGRELIYRLMPIIVDTIGVPLISTNFFNWILKSHAGIKIRDESKKTVEKLFVMLSRNPRTITRLISLKFPLEDKLVAILEKAILPQELTHQFGSNIYPAIQKQILKMLLRTIIKDKKFNDVVPALYAYQATENKDERKKYADNVKNFLWKEMTSEARTQFSLKGDKPPYTQMQFNDIVEELLEQFNKEQFLARTVLKSNTDIQNELANLFKELLEVSNDESKASELRGLIKATITDACGIYDVLVRPPAVMNENDKKVKKEKLGQTFGNHLNPLVEKIENLLKKHSAKNGQNLTSNTIAAVIKDVIDEKPMEKAKFIGDLAVNVLTNFGDVRFVGALINRIAWFSNWVKNKVTENASNALEPYRASFDELSKTITETLEAKLIDKEALRIADPNDPKEKDKVGLDIKEVYNFLLGSGEKKLDCAPELELLAKELYEFAMMKNPPEGWTGPILNWGMRKTLTDQNYVHIYNVLTKVHRAFFGHQMINLSRLVEVLKIVKSRLDIAPALPGPAAPAV